MKEINYEKIRKVEVEYEYNTKTYSSKTICNYENLTTVINYLAKNNIKVIAIKFYE